MVRRAGSDAAAALFSNSAVAEWKRCLARYNALLPTVKGRGADKLVDNDAFVFEELPKLVAARKPEQHITLAELERVMEWKLARGMWRPLQSKVAANKPDFVIEASKKAFAALPDWRASIKVLSTLHGIGPATASAVLAAIRPDLCAFMADEAYEAVKGLGARVYTMKAYEAFCAAMVEKAEELGDDWTPELVSRALWCAGQERVAQTQSVSKQKTGAATATRKRKEPDIVD